MRGTVGAGVDSAHHRSRSLATEGADPRTTGLYQAGEGFERGAKALFPTDPAREDDFSTKVARGAGSFAGFTLGGVAWRLAKLPAALPVLGLGASSEASQTFA